MKTLLCIIHSPSNNTSLIEQKVSEKLKSETSNLNIIIKNPFFANTEDILKADGLLIGTTENLASMAGATKDISHSPKEYTDFEMLEKTTNVMLNTILKIDKLKLD